MRQYLCLLCSVFRMCLKLSSPDHICEQFADGVAPFLIKCDVAHLPALIPDMRQPADEPPGLHGVLLEQADDVDIPEAVHGRKLHEYAAQLIKDIRLFAHDTDRALLFQ